MHDIMSDNKRIRRPGRDKEPRRPIILAKKDERKENSDNRTSQDKPRILLKLKEKEPAPPQISIALRPSSTNQNDTKSSSANAATSTSTTTNDTGYRSLAIQSKPTSKQASTPLPTDQNAHPTKADVTRQQATNENPSTSMSTPISIISDYYHIQNNIQDVLIDTNTDFFVIGVIGTQHTGKSFIANLLIDDIDRVHGSNANRMWNLLHGRGELFKTGASTVDAKHQPCTEGIQMYVTKHRTIILDCSPILCNPYKKDSIDSEMNDLQMLIFLLSVCNQLIVVDDAGFNMHLLRLLRTAEQMKIDATVTTEKGAMNKRFTPNIVFLKNKCRDRSFRNECMERTQRMYQMFFHDCDMRIYSIDRANKIQNKLHEEEDKKHVNVFYFPFVEENSNSQPMGHPKPDTQLTELIQHIYLAPRATFSSQTQQTPFTEKHWLHLALAVWESHKTNYFLRKYETFKEKEWALRI